MTTSIHLIETSFVQNINEVVSTIGNRKREKWQVTVIIVKTQGEEDAENMCITAGFVILIIGWSISAAFHFYLFSYLKQVCYSD